MAKFLKRLLTVSIIFFILEKVFVIFLFLAPQKEYDNRLEKLLNEELKADVFIVGSSRGARSILANQLENSINKTAYNLSYSGSNIIFHEFLVKTIANRAKLPKKILLIMDDPISLYETKGINYRFDRLYPLTLYNEVFNELSLKGENKLLLSPFVLHRLTSAHFDFSEKKLNELDTIQEDGSMPLIGKSPEVVFNYSKASPYRLENESNLKVEALKNIVEITKLSNIELILLITPSYKSFDNSFIESLNEITHSEIKIFNVYDDSFKDENLFYDNGHLNKKGAKQYTQLLANYLKSDD